MNYNSSQQTKKMARVRGLFVAALVLGCLFGTVAQAAQKITSAPALDAITSPAGNSAPQARGADAPSVEVAALPAAQLRECPPPYIGCTVPRAPQLPRCPDPTCTEPGGRTGVETTTETVQRRPYLTTADGCPDSKNCLPPRAPQLPGCPDLRNCTPPREAAAQTFEVAALFAPQLPGITAGQRVQTVCLPNDPNCGTTPLGPQKPAPRR